MSSHAGAPPFGAVLLAGGASRRMGRDKALLPLPDGRVLWQRQLAVLEAMQPAELFLSGPHRPGFPVTLRCLGDDVPGLGPLSGIAAALEVLQSPLLVVLAIDLPLMTTQFLRDQLLARCQPDHGIVPLQPASGYYEPLAAIYPQACSKIARACLRSADHSLQSFIQTCGPRLQTHRIIGEEQTLFSNWNSPVTETGPSSSQSFSRLPTPGEHPPQSSR